MVEVGEARTGIESVKQAGDGDARSDQNCQNKEVRRGSRRSPQLSVSISYEVCASKAFVGLT